ncbi:MAG TPA: OmpH family outer membrane protein [Chitinophagales bacterium]|nr:OmpH family outer membrane protein [Chitinophagales bacterium]
MKKVAVFLAFIFAVAQVAQAQTIGFVDSEGILAKLPAYKKAQDQVNSIVDTWNKEIQQRYKNIDDAYKSFQAEQVLLSATEKAKREQEIVDMEKQTRDLQKQRFGPNGDLQAKREELVKPIQDEVYAALEKVAARKKVDFVFDKSASANMLFANPKFDLTDDVLKELGISGGK